MSEKTKGAPHLLFCSVSVGYILILQHNSIVLPQCGIILKKKKKKLVEKQMIAFHVTEERPLLCKKPQIQAAELSIYGVW